MRTRRLRGHQAVEVLLFDLGGVLVDFAGFEDLAPLLEEATVTASIQERWIRSDAVRRFESGKITAEIFAQIFVTEWQLSLTPEEFLHHFSGWSRGLYPGATRLLRGLQKANRIAYFDDTSVNAQAAAEAGMKAFHVADRGELDDALLQIGVITA